VPDFTFTTTGMPLLSKKQKTDPSAGLTRRSCEDEVRTWIGFDGLTQSTPVAGANKELTIQADAILWERGKTRIPSSAPSFKDDDEGLVQAFAEVLAEGEAKKFLRGMPQDDPCNYSAEATAWAKWLLRMALDTSTANGPAQRVRDIVASAARERHVGRMIKLLAKARDTQPDSESEDDY